MNCHDVREHFATSRGAASLTEQALAYAHVAQCADCQAERASGALAVGPVVEPSRAPATADLIEQIPLALARLASSLFWLRTTAQNALLRAARAGREAAGTEVMRVLGGLTRLPVVMSRSLTVCRRATMRAVEDARARLTRSVGRLPALALPSARAAAGLVGRARFVGARVPPLLAGLGSAGMIACRGAAHAASEGVVMALGFVSRSSGETVRVAGRVVAAGRLEAARTRDGIVRVGGRVPSLLAPSARAVGHLVGGIPDHVRAHPRIFAGTVSGVALVAGLLFLGPHLRPDHLPPRFSTGEEPLRDARLPVDVKPAQPIPATPIVVEVVPARPVSGAQPAPPARVPVPARVPAPTRRADAIPAPVRGSDSRAAEATPTAEPSDPAAAIDWLLKAGGRRSETP